MKVQFQYADWSEWESLPEDAHQSPDLYPSYSGVIWAPGMAVASSRCV